MCEDGSASVQGVWELSQKHETFATVERLICKEFLCRLKPASLEQPQIVQQKMLIPIAFCILVIIRHFGVHLSQQIEENKGDKKTMKKNALKNWFPETLETLWAVGINLCTTKWLT